MKKFTFANTAGAASAIIAAACPVSAQPAGFDFTTIVLSSMEAAGTDGRYFLSFLTPTINASGDLAFSAVLDRGQGGAGFTTDYGIWSTSRSTLRPVVREGSEAPGIEGGRFFFFVSGIPTFSDSGDVAFEALTRLDEDLGEGTVRSGIWSTSGNTLRLVGRGGSDAGIGGARFSHFTRPALDASGNVAFQANLATGENGVDDTNNEGVWLSSGDSFRLIAREGSEAPETGGAKFHDFASPILSASGDLAFRASLRRDENGVDYDNAAGVWSTSGNSLRLVARQGSEAPGTGGANFDFFENLFTDDTGNIAFRASLQTGPTGATFENAKGIWSTSAGTLRLVARRGFEASGTDGAVFDQFSPRLTVNTSGDVAFDASLKAGENGVHNNNNSGIWLTSDGEVHLVAREGFVASGAEAAVFDDLSHARMALNRSGDLAFYARLLRSSDTGVNGTNDAGLWFYSAVNDEVTLIVRKGELFDVSMDPSESDLRTIGQINFLGDQGFASGFNDAGMLAFQLFFTDGTSGIFTAQIPAPGAVGFFVLAGLSAARRRRD